MDNPSKKKKNRRNRKKGASKSPPAAAEEPQVESKAEVVEPTPPVPAAAPTPAAAPEEKKEGKTSKDYYFDSYSHFGIHEEMLKDEVRTTSYMKAIMNNKHLFKGKVVLDVGCGTGILSMFCAKAGAKHVYGVDMASIITQARTIVDTNGFGDVITLIQGKVEEIELPVKQVDIIVSEWMGYFLLYESMLDTVIYARDKWLAPDGILMPDKASIYVCAIEDQEYRDDKINFWDDVYGFDMSVIKEIALEEPLVDVCAGKQVMSDACRVLSIDIATVTKEELDFSSKWKINFNRNDYCHALVAYFNIEFSKTHTKLRFSTSPKAEYTHWKQTVFYLDEPVVCEEGESMTGTINVQRNEINPRDLDIMLTSNHQGKHSNHTHERLYRLR